MKSFYIYDIKMDDDPLKLQKIEIVDGIIQDFTDWSITERHHVWMKIIPTLKVDDYIRDYLYLPYFGFEKEFVKSERFDSYCFKIAGCRIDVEIDCEVKLEEKAEQGLNGIFSPFLVSTSTETKFFNVKNCILDKNDYSDDALKYYRRKHGSSSPSRIVHGMNNSSFTSFDTGYDIDSSFGGEADAYWNID